MEVHTVEKMWQFTLYVRHILLHAHSSAALLVM